MNTNKFAPRRKIAYNLEVGYSGCNDEGEMEVEDNMSDHEITDMVEEMAREHASRWEGDYRLCWHEEMTDEEYDEATEHYYANIYGAWEFVEE